MTWSHRGHRPGWGPSAQRDPPELLTPPPRNWRKKQGFCREPLSNRPERPNTCIRKTITLKLHQARMIKTQNDASGLDVTSRSVLVCMSEVYEAHLLDFPRSDTARPPRSDSQSDSQYLSLAPIFHFGIYALI